MARASQSRRTERSAKSARPATAEWRRSRATFRHGNLPEALVAAALERLEKDGAASLSLRELARDVGVNHRAVYRHFPDKLALLAHVAEVGYRRMAAYMGEEIGADAQGEEKLVAAGVGAFRFARDHRSLMELMAGPRLNEEGAFPALEAVITETLTPFIEGFLELGTDPGIARLRGVLYLFALLGIAGQILHRRLRVTPENAPAFVADIARKLIKGLR